MKWFFSRHRTRMPPLAMTVAAVRPLWPAPTTMASKSGMTVKVPVGRARGPVSIVRPRRLPDVSTRRNEMKGGWRPASLVQPVKCSDLAADLFPMANQPVVAGAGSTASQGNTAGLKGAISKVLANPIMGFAPWIVFSVLEGPHRYPLATGAALALAVLELLLGVVVGARPKILDVAAIVFFAGMLVAGLLVHHDGHVWLDRWSGEVSNAMLVLVALASIVVRAPFTIQYAREMTPEEYWRTPLFIHINYVLTWVWTAVFAVTAAVGWYGDGPLNQPDNIWTNWIVQIALLIFAIRFTEWY